MLKLSGVPLTPVVIGAMAMMVCCAALATTPSKQSTREESVTTRQFTFAWPFAEQSSLRPRGGKTTGPKVTLATTPGERWRALRAPGISKLERDRRAILAMAGEFRTSFDFLETIGFSPSYKPDRPYQSWATEKVYVVEDSANLSVCSTSSSCRLNTKTGHYPTQW